MTTLLVEGGKQQKVEGTHQKVENVVENNRERYTFKE